MTRPSSMFLFINTTCLRGPTSEFSKWFDSSKYFKSSNWLACVGFFYTLKWILIELMQSLVTKINDLDFLRLESSAWNFKAKEYLKSGLKKIALLDPSALIGNVIICTHLCTKLRGEMSQFLIQFWLDSLTSNSKRYYYFFQIRLSLN